VKTLGKSSTDPRPWKTITGNYTAKIGDRLAFDISATQLITLPSNPPFSGEIELVQTMTAPQIITFDFGARLFMGLSPTGVTYNDLKGDRLVYLNATKGWISINRLIHA
jgi:hypothetical protein